MSLHLVARLLFPVALLPAQTFVVDASSGPATDFVDIASAVLAVPDGATLIVRAGIYRGFRIVAKGLSIRADANVAITDGVEVSNTQPFQPVELRGLAWVAAPGQTTSMLACTGCGGLVLLDHLIIPGVPDCTGPMPGLRDPALVASNCPQLLLRHSEIHGQFAIGSSDVVLDQCTLVGEPAIVAGSGPFTILSPARPALAIDGSVVQSTSSIAGGFAWNLGVGTYSPPAPGISLGATAHLRLLRGSVQGGNPAAGSPPEPAITGFSSSVLRADPSVAIVSAAAPVVQGTSALTLGMPALATTDGVVGGTIAASATASSGDAIILLISLPGAVLRVAGFTDAFWLDPTACQLQSFGVPPAGQPLTGAVVVPNQPALQGVQIAWQAVSSSTTTGLQASNAGLSAVL